MYSVCQTTHPATTVEHSIECKFYNLHETNLVVAGANQLSVYRIIKYQNSDTGSLGETEDEDEASSLINGVHDDAQNSQKDVKEEEEEEEEEKREEQNEVKINNSTQDDKQQEPQQNRSDQDVPMEQDPPACDRPIKLEKMDDVTEEDCADTDDDDSIYNDNNKVEEHDILEHPINETKPKLTKQHLPKPELRAQLEFIQSFELYGTVASMQKATLGNRYSCKRDSIVLSFHDAKLSIIEYNPETHDLKTVSMHYFEDESLRDGCVTNHMHPPIVRVDPENRCIAMLIYGRHVVVIPLEKDEEEDLEHDLYNASSSSSSSDEDESMAPIDGDNIRRPLTGQVVTLRAVNSANFKSPVLPSYKIDLSEETCGEKIDNIVDIQFLHNYNDPTLVILYETARTWSGRVAMRQDTYSMVALSMNVHQRLQPIIWTVNNLPYDSLRILPVPKPIGGLLIIACNELIYLNQSVPAFGMSFNSFTKDSSAFPLNDEDNPDKKIDYINISLDLSQAVFLNHNKILFILKDGDVYLVTLFNDDMRSIKNFHFERFASTVQPNCLTLCENNLLFIGSHVGDSMLTEIVGDLKSSHLDSNYDDLDDVDSLISNEESGPIYLYKHDKLLSSSASGRICYGEATKISDYLHHDSRDPYIELITTAGHHKSGSICVFQRTIKPFVEDTYELKDCGNLWTLVPSIHSDPENFRLLLNRDYETKVFSTKGELLELKRSENAFDTSEPTIMAANIGEDNLTLQVVSTGVLLISNDRCIDRVLVDGTICDASVADPHIIVLTKGGTIHHLQLRSSSETSGERRYGLASHEIGLLSKGRIISFSIYKDLSGLFTCRSSRSTNPTYWLLVVDDRGVLDIFSVPDFILVYSVDNFPASPAILADNVKLFVTDIDSNVAKTKEILLQGMGRDYKKPILFSRSELEITVYEAYSYTDVEITNHLKIRFKKISSMLLKTVYPAELEIESHLDDNHRLAITDGRFRGSRHYSNNNGSSQTNTTTTGRPSLRDKWLTRKHWMRSFSNVAAQDGVFLSGFKPCWFMIGERGALRAHQMNVEGSVFGFSQFNATSFIYFTENRELRIARLPSHLDLDAHWPMRKLPMKETVHFVNYHVERKVYCVVTSSPRPCLKIMKVGSEPDTMKIEDLERESGYIAPTTERFRLRLYDPENWERIPDCEIEFEEWEQVTCVKDVLLASEGTKSGLKGYIAISTNYCYGEDVPNRGRILILDLIEVVPKPGRPLTKNKIKKVYCQEQKGPVTTLSHTCGLLMSAVGQKIYLWQLKEEQLDGVAFIDTQIYIHCASSVKNLILVSDVCKDSKPLEVFACAFAVDNELLNFVVTDAEKNIIVYAHDPEHEDSCGGTRLLRRADFHLGSHITSLCRLRGEVPSALAGDQTAVLLSRRRHITMFCTVDGAIGHLYPVHESMYKRLQSLQTEMTISLPHVAGLNPKAWRLVKQARPSIINPCKHILDGDLLARFLLLSLKERNELSKKIGSTTDEVLADIQLIQESTAYF